MNQSANNGGGRGRPTAAAYMFPSPPQRPPTATSSSAGAGPPIGLTRYDSGSFLDESIVGGGAAGGGGGGRGGGATEVAFMGRFLSTHSPSMTSESSCKVSAGGAVGASSSSSPPPEPQRLPYGANDFAASELTMGMSRSRGDDGIGSDGSPLMRHSSSPAGFLSRLMVDNGMRHSGSYSQAGTDAANLTANRRLKSQLSFPNRGTLSQISELNIPDTGESVGHRNHSDGNSGNVGRSYFAGNFSIGSWDEPNSVMFSSSSSKHAKDANGDIITISNLEPDYGFAKSSLDMGTVEKYLQMQHDHVQFKVRAKRGCATHPRSIAERERRTKISEKLRRLQELVPNMDKQTNTADMLDLALQHIKGLQSQVQTLSQERDKCTCSSRKERS